MSEATKSSDDFFDFTKLLKSKAAESVLRPPLLGLVRCSLSFFAPVPHTTKQRGDGTEGACKSITKCTALWYACARVYRH